MIKTKNIHPHIRICRNCGGSGIVQVYEKDDLLQLDPTDTTCPTCEGSGRVLVSAKIETTIKPYKA